MKLTIEGTSEEIKNVLQAICGSEEHEYVTIVDPPILSSSNGNTNDVCGKHDEEWQSS